MNASVPLKTLLLVWMAVLLAGCGARRSVQVPPPLPPANRIGSLAIMSGIKIASSVTMPAGFIPDLTYAPIWLEHGNLVAVPGNTNGRSMLIGFSGADLATQRVIAADDDAGAPDGIILAVAASPDAAMLATVVASRQQDTVAVRVGSGEGEWRTVTAIPGACSGAQIAWLDPATIALVLRGPASTAAPAGISGDAQIFVIKLADPVGVQSLTKRRCALSRMSFSPDGHWAVGQGDPDAPPVMLDLKNQLCTPLDRRDPIRVLAWRPDGLGFLYAAPGSMGVPGVFRYDHAGGISTVVAIASAAAAYASDGTIIAIGNERLTWRSASSAPTQPITAQVALFPAGQSAVTINSLGFETTPELLARASMVFASPSNNGLLDIAAVKMPQPLRRLIEYSYPTRTAFALAGMAPDTVIATSWSPDNRLIALIDGGAQPPRLTLIAAPR